MTLWDAGERIGGQFLMAGMVPGKADFLQTVRYFENELARLGVRFRLGAAVTDAAQLDRPDHVVLATGVLPRPVAIPGGELHRRETTRGDAHAALHAGLPDVIDYPQAFADVATLVIVQSTDLVPMGFDEARHLLNRAECRRVARA